MYLWIRDVSVHVLCSPLSDEFYVYLKALDRHFCRTENAHAEYHTIVVDGVTQSEVCFEPIVGVGEGKRSWYGPVDDSATVPTVVSQC